MARTLITVPKGAKRGDVVEIRTLIAHAMETGHRNDGEGRLVPFVAFDHGIVRGDAFAEQGDTGMELVAASSRQARFSGAVGARYARDWSLGRHRLRLELDARHRRERVDGDPVRAAFRGVPDVRFELPDARAPATGELRVGLGGSRGPRSRWSMDYSRGFGGEHRDEGWMLGVWHAF